MSASPLTPRWGVVISRGEVVASELDRGPERRPVGKHSS